MKGNYTIVVLLLFVLLATNGGRVFAEVGLFGFPQGFSALELAGVEVLKEKTIEAGKEYKKAEEELQNSPRDPSAQQRRDEAADRLERLSNQLRANDVTKKANAEVLEKLTASENKGETWTVKRNGETETFRVQNDRGNLDYYKEWYKNGRPQDQVDDLGLSKIVDGESRPAVLKDGKITFPEPREDAAPRPPSELADLITPKPQTPTNSNAPPAVEPGTQPGTRADPPAEVSPAVQAARADLTMAEAAHAAVVADADPTTFENKLKASAISAGLEAEPTKLASEAYNRAAEAATNAFPPETRTAATAELNAASPATAQRARTWAQRVTEEAALKANVPDGLTTNGASKTVQANGVLQLGADMINRGKEAGVAAMKGANSLQKAALIENVSAFSNTDGFGQTSGAFVNNLLNSEKVSTSHYKVGVAETNLRNAERPYRYPPGGNHAVEIEPLVSRDIPGFEGKYKELVKPAVYADYSERLTTRFNGVATYYTSLGNNQYNYYQSNGKGGYVQVFLPQ